MSDFPGPEWDKLPDPIRRYMTEWIVKRTFALHGGWMETMRWLYAGQERKDGTRLAYGLSARDLWPYLEQDAQKWDDQERAKAQRTEER